MNLRVMPSMLIGLSGLVTSLPSRPSPRDVIEAKFAAVNRHSIPDIIKYYAPDARINSSGFCAPRQGRADVERTYQGLIGTFPDITARVTTWVVQGDRVAVVFITSFQIQGRRIEVPIANFFTVRNGLIQDDDGVYNTGGRPCEA